MRWDDLFADLDAQALELERAERAAEVEERARIEVGALALLDRLRPAVGTRLRVHCQAAVDVTGVLCRVGSDWVLIDEGDGREAVVAARSIVTVDGLRRGSAAPGCTGPVESRLGIGHALRGIARDRSVARLYLSDSSIVDGTLDRVGRDFVEATLHSSGEPRRAGDQRQLRLVALVALVALRRDAQ